jgi:hypothetical protein
MAAQMVREFRLSTAPGPVSYAEAQTWSLSGPGAPRGYSEHTRPARPAVVTAASETVTSQRRGRRVARGAAAMTATAVPVGAAATHRALLAASVATLGHVHWIWIPAVIMLESASIVALAGMQRRLLATGGASIGVRPMLATTFAANALSVSVPLAGPELGTAFTFRRYCAPVPAD